MPQFSTAGFEVKEERYYRTMEVLRNKLNIVATMEQVGVVVDVQLASQQSNLERA